MTQVNAGLNFLFGINISLVVQVILIVGITALATTSVVMGLDGGVKRLSEINMILAGVFMVLILILGLRYTYSAASPKISETTSLTLYR